MTMIRILHSALLIALYAGVLLLSACTTTPHVPVTVQAERVWPEPPAAPRIRYVRSFHRAEDLGIEKSIWQKLGEFITGPSITHLVRPMDVVADARGETIYVADPGAKGVHRFDLRSGKYRLLRLEEEQELSSPVGLALGAEDQVFITDSGLGQLFTVKPGEKFLRPVTLDAELQQPTGIVYDPATGLLYIVDTAAHAIKVFTPSGVLRRQFGRRGTEPGEFNYPTSLWLDAQHRLLVNDSLNFRIQLLNPDGGFIDQFGSLGDASGDLSRPKGVASDHSGHIYVVDAMFHAFQVFDEHGDLLLHLGVQGHNAGEFWLPTGIFIAPDDTIYIADSHNQRVQVFRYIGGTP